MSFAVGQRVRKVTGYGFEGPISGINHKQDGTINYTVELQIGCIADGMQHIFSAAQLEEASADTARPAAVECKARKSVAEQGLHAATIQACVTWWEQNGGRFARQRAELMRRALLPQPKGGE